MGKTNKKKGKLKRKLTDKYRLVVLNENTFEERFSLKLSRLNVFVLGGVFSVLLVAITVVFIAFTPIKEYIPGYSSTALKAKAARLTFKTDSLKTKLDILNSYTSAIVPVLKGDLEPEKIDSLQVNAVKKVLINLDATKEDSIFREKIESRDRFAIQTTQDEKVKIVFFSPLSGTISQNFDLDSKHLAVDIVAKKDTPVKTIADGTVVFVGWTIDAGYVIVIKHSYNYISVYKHNGSLLKEQGDFVKSGEVIASVGSTGELTTGPHLHFELWSDGYAVNPTNYIDFK